MLVRFVVNLGNVEKLQWKHLPSPPGIGCDGPGLGAPGQRSFDQHRGGFRGTFCLKGKLKGAFTDDTDHEKLCSYMRRT